MAARVSSERQASFISASGAKPARSSCFFQHLFILFLIFPAELPLVFGRRRFFFSGLQQSGLLLILSVQRFLFFFQLFSLFFRMFQESAKVIGNGISLGKLLFFFFDKSRIVKRFAAGCGNLAGQGETLSGESLSVVSAFFQLLPQRRISSCSASYFFSASRFSGEGFCEILRIPLTPQGKDFIAFLLKFPVLFLILFPQPAVLFFILGCPGLTGMKGRGKFLQLPADVFRAEGIGSADSRIRTTGKERSFRNFCGGKRSRWLRRPGFGAARRFRKQICDGLKMR